MAMGDDSCAGPQLLVAVQSTSNGAGHGRIARLALTATTQTTCPMLEAHQAIGPTPQVIAGFAGGVAIASADTVYFVDPRQDVVIWSHPVGSLLSVPVAVDAFAMQDTGGKPIVAIATAIDTSSPAIRQIDVFATDGSTPAKTPWCLQAGCDQDLQVGLGILGMAVDPAAPTHLLALDTDADIAALSIDPYAPTHGTVVGNLSRPLLGLSTVVAPTRRYVWIVGGSPNSIIYSGDGQSGISNPIYCSGCDPILHAVADPTDPGHFFMLCDGATPDARRVVRTDSTGHCTTVLSGSTLPANTRMARLGLAP